MNSFRSVTPQQYAELIQEGKQHILVDVREPWEFQLARIEGAILMPLQQIQDWSLDLAREQVYVVMCHHGVRSAYACQILSNKGYPEVYNLAGGIDAWSNVVDPGVRKY